ncbi:DUF1402 family protein [Mesorhizobium sp. M0047]|uniref:DUF1402 family protein n=1 Tax=Mesorhizobium sp. M0047 TaxID=2956859 RepID=UPI003337BA11
MQNTKHAVTALALLALIIAGGLAGEAVANGLTVVPPGNRFDQQPPIPEASANRTRAFNTTYDAKYDKILTLLRSEKKLVQQIKDAASAYGIDPIHIVGALVGEHTYNVSSFDAAQTYYVKALAYANADFAFRYKGISLQSFLDRPEFSPCAKAEGSSSLWSCRTDVWNKQFLGETVDDVAYENVTFQRAFFQPFFAGQTFGLGQISRLAALEVTDLVHRVSGFEKLSPDRPQAIYRDIMDPKRSVIYTAAILREAINAYADEGFDISRNPGITATLYNVGQPQRRAAELRGAAAKRSGRKLPEENYYGWFVNTKLDELRALLDGQG